MGVMLGFADKYDQTKSDRGIYSVKEKSCHQRLWKNWPPGSQALFEYENEDRFEIVATNSRTSAEQRAYLFKYDSVHRKFGGEVAVAGDSLVINGKTVKVLSESEVDNLPWGEMGVDLVIESSGKYTDRAKASKHLEAGARKVLITAPARNEDATIVMGVNEGIYDPSRHNIISNASCTTNCLALWSRSFMRHSA